jgi:tetraacyldisaccharide 4'-kinase
MDVRRLSAWLESPAGWARCLAGAPWAQLAPVTRHVAPGLAVPVVGIGGATLGGSGRTPLVLACAEWLSSRARVAVIAHGYGGVRGHVRCVQSADRAEEVGDESVFLARRLPTCAVWVGPSRAETMHAAAHDADILIVDGLLQTRPTRLALSLLAVHEESPWGSGAALPAGDLRAAPSRLVQATDHMVRIGGVDAALTLSLSPWGDPLPQKHAQTLLGLSHYAGEARVGLFLSVARPKRVQTQLAHVAFEVSIEAPDHRPGVRANALRAASVDAWVMTEKCFVGLAAHERPRARTIVLRQHLTLSEALCQTLQQTLGA